ncbi:MAG: GIY-YIG nuclease family protein [Intestinibacter sp.]
MKKKCSRCGKTKDIKDFYKRKKEMQIYGPNDLRSYRHVCKKCNCELCKERNIKYANKHNGGIFLFVYFIYDNKNKLVYVGKTKDIVDRIKDHHRDKKIDKNDISKVSFELVESECDACVREIYYINKYKPKLNQRDIFDGKMTCTTINKIKKYTVKYISNKQFSQEVENIINKRLKNK